VNQKTFVFPRFEQPQLESRQYPRPSLTSSWIDFLSPHGTAI
jgi:hypothetical protein